MFDYVKKATIYFDEKLSNGFEVVGTSLETGVG